MPDTPYTALLERLAACDPVIEDMHGRICYFCSASPSESSEDPLMSSGGRIAHEETCLWQEAALAVRGRVADTPGEDAARVIRQAKERVATLRASLLSQWGVREPKWWFAANLNGPFTPTGEGDNDGLVRDGGGKVVADCRGHEARADVIAELLNRLALCEPHASVAALVERLLSYEQRIRDTSSHELTIDADVLADDVVAAARALAALSSPGHGERQDDALGCPVRGE